MNAIVFNDCSCGLLSFILGYKKKIQEYSLNSIDIGKYYRMINK